MPISLSATDSSFDRSTNQSNPLVVTATPLPSLPDLARIWSGLEARAEGSFFTSWTWIGTWLALLSDTEIILDNLVLITAREQTTIVGLGIICPTPRGWGSIGRRRILLHQTGRLPQDSIYIEYNDFLVDAAISHRVRVACLQFLGTHNEISRFRINAATQSVVDAFATAAVRYHIFRVETCVYTDLTQIPTPGAMSLETEAGKVIGSDPLLTTTESYLTCLSRNSRQQIRRSLRLAERDGQIRLVRATDPNEATAALTDLIQLHTTAWNQRKGLPGAFAEPYCMRFIADLVKTGNATGAVDLLRIEAGTHTIGVLLNFVHHGEVYTYQSGFSYNDDNRFKPGLVCHAMAAAYYKQQGYCGYHFMAGENRYKSTLSNATETLYWLETGCRGFLSRARHERAALQR